MAGSVTVPGAGGTTISVGGSSSNQFLASIIRNSILQASVAAGGANYVTAVSMAGGQWSLPAAPVVPNSKPGTDIEIAVIPSVASGAVSIPFGYQYAIDESTTATVSGGNVQIISADGPATLSGNVSLSGVGNNTLVVNGTYNVYLGGSGTNNVSLTGQGTYSGSTGTNNIIVTDTAAGGSEVISNGTDSIQAHGDNVTVVGSGTYTVNAGSTANVTVQATGSGDDLLAGSGAMNASTGGSDALVLGGSGSLNVEDSGTGDFIAALGASAASIAAWGKDAVVFAGSNGTTVTLSGGTNSLEGSNTAVGGSGPTTVTLGTVQTHYLTVLGGGGDSIVPQTLFSEHNLAIGGSGALTVNDFGFSDTVVAFSASVVSIFAAGQSGTYLGGSNDFTVTLTNGDVGNNGSNNTVVGTSGNMTVAAGGVNDIIFGGSGSLSVAGQAGNAGDTIAAFGASTATILLANEATNPASVGSSGALVFGGTGALSVTVQDAANTIVGGSSGTNTIDLQSISGSLDNHNLVVGGSGALTVKDDGTSDTIGAFGTTQATLAGSQGVFFGLSSSSVLEDGSNDTIVAGSGTASVTAGGSSSGLVLVGGSGTLIFTGGANPVTVLGGSGVTSITGGAGGITLFGAANGNAYFNGSGSLTFLAGAGNETLDAAGSSGNNNLVAGSDSNGNDSLVGGSGTNSFIAGAGADTMASGSGNNAFAFFAQATDGKADVVTNWTQNDSLFVVGYSPADSAQGLLDNATIGANGVTLTLSDNTTITFTNLTNTTELQGHILYSPS